MKRSCPGGILTCLPELRASRTVGRLVELSGNRIRIGDMKFSVNSPGIDTAHKSTLFFGLHELDERALVER